ncbi:unnamed protein product [Acanthoscelides obtectus]|uniref:Uncharacterized protein n=1 Tax=Acanthoscelides obtectus TaxID=200917 RepID=A0A9P0LJK0_ACAOB|nr:unnamed protein product [Acanthoscelides obtectus]CAK1628721.1 hypothetical protein AOBTE_LOCUS5363 [Acanthoscelides obtectus]
MLSFKKVYREELLQLALLLSLLRVNNDPFQELDLYDGVNTLDFDNGTSWQQITPAVLRSHYVNPKSLDSVLLNYERDLFADVHSLGRFNRHFRHPDVTTYLLNIERTAAVTTPEPAPAPIPPTPPPTNATENNAEAGSSPTSDGIGLTQEVSLDSKK